MQMLAQLRHQLLASQPYQGQINRHHRYDRIIELIHPNQVIVRPIIKIVIKFALISYGAIVLIISKIQLVSFFVF